MSKGKRAAPKSDTVKKSVVSIEPKVKKAKSGCGGECGCDGKCGDACKCKK